MCVCVKITQFSSQRCFCLCLLLSPFSWSFPNPLFTEQNDSEMFRSGRMTPDGLIDEDFEEELGSPAQVSPQIGVGSGRALLKLEWPDYEWVFLSVPGVRHSGGDRFRVSRHLSPRHPPSGWWWPPRPKSDRFLRLPTASERQPGSQAPSRVSCWLGAARVVCGAVQPIVAAVELCRAGWSDELPSLPFPLSLCLAGLILNGFPFWLFFSSLLSLFSV